MVNKKNIKINSVLNLLKTISSILFPFITFPYISRILQPENIGKINFSSSFVSYFTLLATLGITTYAIRECSAVKNDKQKLEKIASEIFSINVCTTIVAYVLLLVSLVFFRWLDSYRTVIIIQSISILLVTLGADWLNTAMEDFVYVTVRTITFQVIAFILMFMFIKVPEDYVKYVCISVFSSSGANLFNVFYRRRYCEIRFTTKMRWGIHFKPILLLFVMILAQTIFNNIDVTMLGLMKDDFEVGIYSTAVKIENIIAQVVSSLAWVIMPRMSTYFIKGDYEKINKMLRKVLEVLILIGFPLIAGVLSISKEIVLIIGGEKYIEARTPLIILMFSFFFSLLGGSFLGNMVLLPSKREKTYMWICCVSTTVNVILNYFLIPFWGANAAAATTALSSLIIMILLFMTKDKRIKLYYIGHVLISPLIGAICILIYCYLIGLFVHELLLKTIICIGGSIIIYGIIMIILKNKICTEFFFFIKKKLNRE